MLDYPNVVPIWGVQRMTELEEWLSFFDKEPVMTDEIKSFIKNEQKELSGDFCRGCGACMSRCPYSLKTPELLKKNLAGYSSFACKKSHI